MDYSVRWLDEKEKEHCDYCYKRNLKIVNVMRCPDLRNPGHIEYTDYRGVGTSIPPGGEYDGRQYPAENVYNAPASLGECIRKKCIAYNSEKQWCDKYNKAVIVPVE
jgi:hypothetical protein